MGVIIPQVVTEDRAGGALVIDGGLRFDSSKSHNLINNNTRSASSADYTVSVWIKRVSLNSSGLNAILQYETGATFAFSLTFYADKVYAYDSSGNDVDAAYSDGVLRDTSGWYHLHYKRTSGGTGTLYINGVQQSKQTSGTLNIDAFAYNGSIGYRQKDSTRYLDAYLSNLYVIDGQALNPSSFGFTDPLTNTWRPKKYNGTYGTKGFYLPMDGNSPIGQDQSGRGNNWTPVNFGGSNTIEKATGALPILNTDGGGKVARVGVRTDSNASSLVLALPLVGIKSDFSNAINGGTSNKAITANSATASSSYSNFYGGSFYFNGSSNLTLNLSSVSLSSPYTVEFWWYKAGTQSGNHGHFCLNGANNQTIAYREVAATGTGANDFYIDLGGSFVPGIITQTISTGSWNHFAFVHEGSGVLKSYLNGVLQTTKSIGTSGTMGSTTSIGGGIGSYTGQFINGYVQDYRIYQGAKYTQNFIPASTDPDILPDTPSGVAYSSNVALVPSTDGAVAFDGSGDYLSVASSSDLTFGTGDFTLEYFINTKDTDFNFMHPASSSGSGYWGHLIQSSSFKWNDAYATTNLWEVSATPILDGRWHHCAICRASGVTKVFFDGLSQSVTSGTFTDNTNYSGVDGWKIGGSGNLSDFNGFISNLHIVKGTALYTSNFTPPTAPITSVANTKLLCCKSNSSATAFDVSPGSITANGNAAASNFNPFTVNINTQRGQESGYATLDPLRYTGTMTFSNGNLNVSGTSVNASSNIAVRSGKWYAEFVYSAIGSTVGLVAVSNKVTADALAGATQTWQLGYTSTGKLENASSQSNTSTFAVGDTISVAFDCSTGTATFYKNGISVGSITNSAFANVDVVIGGGYGGANGSDAYAANFGQKPFKFPPPAGFQPLALANTPRPTIVRPDQYVGIATFTGTGAARSLTTGFKPDLVWIKDRTNGYNHVLFDSVRGTGGSKVLFSNRTTAEGGGTGEEGTVYGHVSSFDNYGFSVSPGSGTPLWVSNSGDNYVAWAWKAGGNSNTFNINDVGYATASAAGLTSGTITPTGASVNTKSGFSIITYTGQTASGSIAHGLGQEPKFIITKVRSGGAQSWGVYHKDVGINNYLLLDSTGASTSYAGIWGSSAPTSTVLNLPGNVGLNNYNTWTYVAYLWAEIPGFSKFGSYTGNGSTDGPMVITGFRPRWILWKRTDSTSGWGMRDTARNSYNAANLEIAANTGDAEVSGQNIDILSNGFKPRTTDTWYNASGGTYIYAAFAETPSFNLYGGQANAR